MPKEFRKRGKRSKKNKDEDSHVVYAEPEERAQHRLALGDEHVTRQRHHQDLERKARAEISGVAAAVNGHALSSAVDGPVSPWPAVDPDTKAYFKQLEERIIELEQLQASGHASALGGDDEGADPEDDNRVLLLRAALTQLSGKETALATDPETSVILERLIYSMDDFARRVLTDRLTGQFAALAQDRFASHVLQTLIVLGGGETAERERRGKSARGLAHTDSLDTRESGELPSFIDLIVTIADELRTESPKLIVSQHGSYVLRNLLVVLGGRALPFDSYSTRLARDANSRSKKAAKWKAHNVPAMRSFMPATESASYIGKGKGPEKRIVPPAFDTALDKLVKAADKALCQGKKPTSTAGAQACRLMSDDPIATAIVQILLEIEHQQGLSERPDSIMDRLLEGKISATADTSSREVASGRSDFIETLLRSTVSSHVLELLISLCPDHIFDMLFITYFKTRIARLAAHPVANFVVAKVVDRANQAQVEAVVDEIGEPLSGMIENSRTGTIKALLERTAVYGTRQAELSTALKSAFHIRNEQEVQYLISCGLQLMTLSLFRRNSAFSDTNIQPEVALQGALLLQAWLRLPGSPVVDSLLAVPFPRLMTFARDPMASHVIDAFLDESNTAISRKQRVAFLKSLIGHYHQLADDRIASHVAEKCWTTADPFLRDKIAASLLDHEGFLHGSQYGRFLLRKVNLPSYRKNRYDWRSKQAQGIGGTPAELHAQAAKDHAPPTEAIKAVASQQPAPPGDEPIQGKDETVKRTKRKADAQDMDEIDELFKKPKKGKSSTAARPAAAEPLSKPDRKVPKDLAGVLKAIKSSSVPNR